MVTIEEMKKAVKKHVKVELVNGKIFQGLCTEYNEPEDDDEKDNITVHDGYYYELNIDRIKSIEILD